MKHFSAFVSSMCHVEDGQFAQSSRLYQAFVQYLKSNNIPVQQLSNKAFTTYLKGRHPEYEHGEKRKYNGFFGLCLKGEYEEPEPPKPQKPFVTLKVAKEEKRKYDKKYYAENRAAISAQRSGRRYEQNAMIDEFCHRAKLTLEQYHYFKHHGIIRYVMNGREIDWTRTIEDFPRIAREKLDKVTGKHVTELVLKGKERERVLADPSGLSWIYARALDYEITRLKRNAKAYRLRKAVRTITPGQAPIPLVIPPPAPNPLDLVIAPTKHLSRDKDSPTSEDDVMDALEIASEVAELFSAIGDDEISPDDLDNLRDAFEELAWIMYYLGETDLIDEDSRNGLDLIWDTVSKTWSKIKPD